MIPNIGPLEIAIVLIIALIVFGPKRLPELGKSLGKGINEFREGVSKIGDDDKDEDDDDDEFDTEPAALTPPPGDEPEVTEIVNDDTPANDVEAKPAEEAEPVESEVVPERQD
ncbi:MAG TPA: twin-arginine translocase TatA/TatE family subunit [Solirubrobacterales bacterium]|nr:twin-arginine translocase TatA/TatE family subunit [Solirubrobacterales bacterium]